MQAIIDKQKLDVLQLRIAVSPKEERADLQARLDKIVCAFEQSQRLRTRFDEDRDEDRDADIEVLFDNLPV